MVTVYSTKQEINMVTGVERSRRKFICLLFIVLLFIISVTWYAQSTVFKSYFGHRSYSITDNDKDAEDTKRNPNNAAVISLAQRKTQIGKQLLSESDQVTEEEIQRFHDNNSVDDDDDVDDNNDSKMDFTTDNDNDMDFTTDDTINEIPKTSAVNPPSKKIITKEIFVPKGEYKQRYPQAIVAGVKKGGTRALLSFIAKHPYIASAGKEMHYFDKKYHKKDIQWYLKQMPLSYENQITMEKTPKYFVTKDAPECIAKLNKNMKLIFIFREPVERAISDLTQGYANKKGTKDPTKVFMKHSDPDKVNEEQSHVYVGLYYKNLLNWIKYFPISQMLFVNGNQFIKNPANEMIKVQKFLDIPVLINEDSFVFNKTKGFWCIKLLKDGVASPDCLGPSKGRKHTEIDSSIMKKLTDFYRPHNEDFFKFIGEDYGWPTTKRT